MIYLQCIPHALQRFWECVTSVFGQTLEIVQHVYEQDLLGKPHVCEYPHL